MALPAYEEPGRGPISEAPYAGPVIASELAPEPLVRQYSGSLCIPVLLVQSVLHQKPTLTALVRLTCGVAVSGAAGVLNGSAGTLVQLVVLAALIDGQEVPLALAGGS